MTRLEIGMLGIREMRWQSPGRFVVMEHTVHFWGSDDVHHRNEMVVILNKETASAVMNILSI